jgi:hypothetical protein
VFHLIVYLDLGPVRLSLSTKISHPFNNIFLSQQISIASAAAAKPSAEHAPYT